MAHTIRNAIIAIAILFVISVIGFYLYFAFNPVIKESAGVTFLLKAGTSSNRVVDELTQENIVAHPALVTLWIYLRGDAKQLKIGEYFFPKGASFLTIWTQMVSGTGRVYHPFTIIPGWSFAQLREAMQETQGLVHSTKNLNDAQLMQQLGYPELSPQGEFLPETYFYTYGATDLSLYKQAFNLMQKRLAIAWSKRSLSIPFRSEERRVGKEC